MFVGISENSSANTTTWNVPIHLLHNTHRDFSVFQQQIRNRSKLTNLYGKRWSIVYTYIMFTAQNFSSASVCTPQETRPVSPRPIAARYYHTFTYFFMWSTLFLSDFSQNWNKSTNLGKNHEIWKFTQIREVKVALFRADRQTDRRN